MLFRQWNPKISWSWSQCSASVLYPVPNKYNPHPLVPSPDSIRSLCSDSSMGRRPAGPRRFIWDILTGCRSLRAFCSVRAAGLFPWGLGGRGVKLPTHLRLMPKLRMHDPYLLFLTCFHGLHKDNLRVLFSLWTILMLFSHLHLYVASGVEYPLSWRYGQNWHVSGQLRKFLLQPGMFRCSWCSITSKACVLPFAFHASDIVLPRFVCRTATKKNNEIHSDPRFLEGRQMGSHFLKSTTVQKLRFFFTSRNGSSSIWKYIIQPLARV